MLAGVRQLADGLRVFLLDMRYEPTVWAVGVLFVLSSQLGFWLDAAGPRLFEPRDLGGSIGLCLGVTLFWVPLACILVMAGAQRGGWSREAVARQLALRLAVTALTVVTLTAGALLLLAPATATLLLTPEWAGLFDVHWPRFLRDLDYFARGIWLGLAYGSLCALLTALFRSRALGAVLAVVVSIAEPMVRSFLIPPYSPIGWLNGLSPSVMYGHWLGDELRSFGFMRNLLGLEDGLQGFLVMGGYLLLSSLLTWAVVRWRGRPVGAPALGAPAPAGASSRVPESDGPAFAGPALAAPAAGNPAGRARVFCYAAATVFGLCAALALGLGLLLAALGPSSPRGTAWEYVNANLDQAASVAAAGLVAGKTEQDRLARGLRDSWRSVVFPFTCDDVPAGELQREPVPVSCSVMSLEFSQDFSRKRIPLLVEVHRARWLGFPVHRVDRILFQGAAH